MNFGTSGYDVTDKDQIIDIGSTNDLSELKLSDKYLALSDSVPKLSYLRSCWGGIEFPIKRFGGGLVDRVVMLWDGEGPWIALTYGEWLESGSGMDSHFWGPYSLDDYCKKQILRFYGLDEGDIGLEDVEKTSPFFLRDLKEKMRSRK